MRDPNRINNYIKKLKDIWKGAPDLRFGQLLMNLLNEVQRKTGIDPFYIEAHVFYDILNECYDDSLIEREKTSRRL